MSAAGLACLHMDVAVGDLLVARLWQWNVARLRKDAERDHRERLSLGHLNPDFSVSVFGLLKRDAQTVEELMVQLAKHAATFRMAKWVAFTTSERLLDAGFPIRSSEPPLHHYDVVLGTRLGDADLARLAAIFDEHPRRRFPTCSPE